MNIDDFYTDELKERIELVQDGVNSRLKIMKRMEELRKLPYSNIVLAIAYLDGVEKSYVLDIGKLELKIFNLLQTGEYSAPVVFNKLRRKGLCIDLVTQILDCMVEDGDLKLRIAGNNSNHKVTVKYTVVSS